MVTKTFQLQSGRSLTYETVGDHPKTNDNILPVLFSHGLSDSRLVRHHDDEYTTKTLGVYWIAVDQPGVGGSTPVRGRIVLNYAKDVEELINHELGPDRKFAVAGHSGGSPHTLAIAHHMKDRVTRGALAGPAAPVTFPPFSSIMKIKGIGWTLWFLRLLPLWVVRVFLMTPIAWYARADIDRYLNMVAHMDRTDRNPDTFLAEEPQRKLYHKSFVEGFAQGSEGIAGMVEAIIVNEWGFDFTQVPQHFDIFYGDLDASLKPALGQAMADAMVDATFHSWSDRTSGRGHYSFTDKKCWTEFIGCLKVQ